MDRAAKALHNSNMTSPTVLPSGPVPVYALYGNRAEEPRPNWVHCESIAARSALYDWEIDPHRHEAFRQILFVRAGGGEAWLAGRRAAIEPGFLVLVPPLAVHGFRFTPDIDGHVITVVEARLRDFLAGASDLTDWLARPVMGVVPAGPRARMAAQAEIVADELASPAPDRRLMVEAALTLLLATARRALGPGASDPDAGHDGPAARHVSRFRALIDRHFREEKSVGAYAGRMGLTPAHLNRCCVRVLGIGAGALIRERVIEEARGDLTFSDLSVKQIALGLGFSDPAYFTRLFAKRVGCPPARFRALARARIAAGAGSA